MEETIGGSMLKKAADETEAAAETKAAEETEATDEAEKKGG